MLAKRRSLSFPFAHRRAIAIIIFFSRRSRGIYVNPLNYCDTFKSDPDIL